MTFESRSRETELEMDLSFTARLSFFIFQIIFVKILLSDGFMRELNLIILNFLLHEHNVSFNLQNSID